MTDRIKALEDALRPFSRVAGEMFARNWNRDDVAILFGGECEEIRLTFADFLSARAALAASQPAPDTLNAAYNRGYEDCLYSAGQTAEPESRPVTLTYTNWKGKTADAQEGVFPRCFANPKYCSEPAIEYVHIDEVNAIIAAADRRAEMHECAMEERDDCIEDWSKANDQICRLTAELDAMRAALKPLTVQDAARVPEIAELIEKSEALRADMLERAQHKVDVISGGQYRIVNAGNTAWYEFDAALRAIAEGRA